MSRCRASRPDAKETIAVAVAAMGRSVPDRVRVFHARLAAEKEFRLVALYGGSWTHGGSAHH